MSRLAKAIVRWMRSEPMWLIAMIVIVGGFWGFAKLSSEIIEGETQAFDEWVVQSLRHPDELSQPIGPAWLGEAARDITGLGGTTILAMVTLATAGFLYIRGGKRLTALLLATTGSGTIASLLLKKMFSRPRPEVVPHLSEVYTSSFPSGHSMMSAVVYLTLAAIVSATMTERVHKLYVFGIALVVTGLVGLSRVYLGVHYPTDVLGGWTAGLVWALLAWSMTNWLQVQHAVEQPTSVPDLNN